MPLRLPKDGNNTFKSAVDAFAANICDLYGAAPQIVDGFCEFLARNACLSLDGYADMPVPCQLYVAEGISKMAYQQAMNSPRFKLDTDASVEFADKFINDNVTTPTASFHLNDACIAIENVKAATSTPSVPEASVKFAVTQAAFEHKTVDHFDDAPARYTDETDAESGGRGRCGAGPDADATGIIARPDTDHPACPTRRRRPRSSLRRTDRTITRTPTRERERDMPDPRPHGDIRGQYGPYGQDAYGSTYKQGYYGPSEPLERQGRLMATHPAASGQRSVTLDIGAIGSGLGDGIDIEEAYRPRGSCYGKRRGAHGGGRCRPRTARSRR